MKFKRFIALSMIFAMLFSVSSYAENAKDINQLRGKIEKKVRKEYEKDPEFQMEVRDLGEEVGEKMINQIIESRLKKALNSNVRGGNGSIFYVSVPLIKQNNYYYCGPANTLQAIYGLGKEDNVSGSSDSDKQYTLGANMGTKPGIGTYVYKVKNELNKYAEYDYIYEKGSNMTESEFRDNITYSLMYNYAPILHAKTEYLSYYNGYSTGHYITVNFINLDSQMVNLQDTNNKTEYYGSHEVPLSEAYNSISEPSNRYLIYLPY
ncbi:cysteine peptidase family C39 domain-containing protein [Paramaledivibacter caminithermalis]|jgi:hypothetical protein|uniref:Peptidase_C39 like family protein n=1 Tax=Paramaledivibacter caminithermalis (strain DSM 15212 / CIP 107654 / DViRD3) TaxID=1121301 RepID=A0A1M6N1I8_PARC5|nr:hypothetical protein [Paramaledivibacter caminithermalis]SHJ89544.1 hypothetical protein SAMN02745912_01528 [Paramaledivibacter caminithermalis DSM 15212]